MAERLQCSTNLQIGEISIINENVSPPGCPQGDIIEHCQSTQLQALIVCLPSISLTTENALCGLITPQVKYNRDKNMSSISENMTLNKAEFPENTFNQTTV